MEDDEEATEGRIHHRGMESTEFLLVHRLAYNGDGVAFKMGRRLGSDERR
jgi:hypothetical protein